MIACVVCGSGLTFQHGGAPSWKRCDCGRAIAAPFVIALKLRKVDVKKNPDRLISEPDRGVHAMTGVAWRTRVLPEQVAGILADPEAHADCLRVIGS